jgi:2-haloacid dehalogenase
VFPEVPETLEELRRRGWNLAILSNTDRALIMESEKALGVPFDLIVTAEDVGSYKPAHGHWSRFFEQTTADREQHVHVGASLFHDVAPARELGLKIIWINRLGEEPEPEPDRELPDLSGLPDAVDELAPASE